ncbi:MAG: chorismate mutase [Acidobacteriota bacterium]
MTTGDTTPNITKEEAQRLLSDSRAKIDSLDRKIVDLLNQRTLMVEDIGRAKTALGTPVLEPRREENVFRNVMLHNHGPISNEALKCVFEQIMKEMRALQGMKREPETTSEPKPEAAPEQK